MSKDITIELVQCASGHDVKGLIIGGMRITRAKCCGNWKTLRTFKAHRDDVLSAIVEAGDE